MDEALRRFRRQVHDELGDRYGAERRYSVPLRQAAVVYWRTRARTGDGLRTVAGALGVAPMSLRRWTQADRLAPVAIVPDPVARPPVTVIVEATQVRVEGLDVVAAAQLIAHLR